MYNNVVFITQFIFVFLVLSTEKLKETIGTRRSVHINRESCWPSPFISSRLISIKWDSSKQELTVCRNELSVLQVSIN